MTKLTQEVHGYFDEEKLMHKSSGSEYFDKQRQCYKYHYTNETGLKGILTTCRLWLMDSAGLNDRSEGKLILQQAKNKLRNINKKLLREFEYKMAPKLEHFYSCSFSFYGIFE